MKGYSCVGLVTPKTVYNIGAVLRASGCFDVSMVAIEHARYRKAATDTMRAHRQLPLLQVDDLHEVVPYDCIPVGVELVEGAVSLTGYIHPQRVFYVFGPEDGTLGKRHLSWCRDIVMIPTNGCLNLAACVNVVLYDRKLKQEARN